MKFAIVTGGSSVTAPGRPLSIELLERGLPGHELEGVAADAITTGGTALPTVACYPELGHSAAVYRQSTLVLCTSTAAERVLHTLGVEPCRVRRWRHAVDPERFSPAWYSAAALTGEGTDGPRVNLLHVGPLDQESGVEQVVDAVQFARERNPRVHLVLVGSGPLEELLRARLGDAATFVATPSSEQLARIYASADLLVCAGRGEGCGQTVLEAQASGLPVLAFNEGEPAELVEGGRSGVLVPPTTIALAEAIRWLARRGTLRERLATGGLQAVRERTWEQALAELGAAVTQTLGAGGAAFARAA